MLGVPLGTLPLPERLLPGGVRGPLRLDAGTVGVVHKEVVDLPATVHAIPELTVFKLRRRRLQAADVSDDAQLLVSH